MSSDHTESKLYDTVPALTTQYLYLNFAHEIITLALVLALPSTTQQLSNLVATRYENTIVDPP